MTNKENLKLVNKAIQSIIDMEDVGTLDEQFDAIDALRKLRTKLKHKEEPTNDGTENA